MLKICLIPVKLIELSKRLAGEDYGNPLNSIMVNQSHKPNLISFIFSFNRFEVMGL